MPVPGNPQLVGDPVDTLTGAVVDRVLDFRLTGPIELRWTRHYDSAAAERLLSVGRGSAHEYERWLSRDEEGLLYDEPLRRNLRFPALEQDGASCASGGTEVARLAVDRYLLTGHGEPAMEFVFPPGAGRARLTRLLQGDAEVRFEYDAGQRLVGIDAAAGRRLMAEEAPDGRLLRLTLAASAYGPERLLIAYRYDAQGCLIATADAKGRGYRMAYDADHRMVQRRCLTGFAFAYGYDEQGRCVSAQGEDRLYGVELEYVVPARYTRVTRPDGGVWGYVFAEQGALVEVHDPLGGVQRFVYDAEGRRTADLDPKGNETRTEYDGAGAAVARIDPHGWRIPLPEDPTVAHPLDHRVADNPAEYEFGRALEVRSIRVPDRVALEDLHLPATVVGLLRPEPDVPAAPAAEPTFEETPLGYPWWPAPEAGRVFDDFGRLRRQRDRAGRLRRWRYDIAGNVGGFEDFDGQHWFYDWGRWHFLLRTIDPLGGEVQYSYSPYGQVTTCTDAGGTLSEYGYDHKDQLCEVRRHGVVRETYERDVAGNLTVKYATDGRLLLAQRIGPGNQPVQRTLGSGDVHDLKYDKAGRLIGGGTLAHRVAMAYDDLGNRTLELRDGLGVEMAFSDWGVPASQVYLGRCACHWAMEEDSSPTGVRVLTDPGGQQHRLRIGDHGIVERWLANGSHEVAQYDTLGRCLFKHARLGSGRDWTRRYHWSGEGELSRVEDSLLGVVEHEYDAAHRLTGRRIRDRLEVYRLDAAGNLIKQPGLEGVELMPGNRLAAANGERFTYNDRNHVALREGADGPIAYQYDSLDQLVGIDLPTGRWTAQYDILGRRVSKRWRGRRTDFYWYGDQLAAEIAPDGRLRLYVYADPLALSPFLMLEYDSVEAEAGACRRYYLYSDQLGTPCVIEDDGGRLVWWGRVAPYGALKVNAPVGMAFPLRWPGHYLDTETGLHYNRFRYFDPGLGRYLQSDPLGIAGGVNLYGYLTNPLAAVDVRGLSGLLKCPPEPTAEAMPVVDAPKADPGNVALAPVPLPAPPPQPLARTARTGSGIHFTISRRSTAQAEADAKQKLRDAPFFVIGNRARQAGKTAIAANSYCSCCKFEAPTVAIDSKPCCGNCGVERPQEIQGQPPAGMTQYAAGYYFSPAGCFFDDSGRLCVPQPRLERYYSEGPGVHAALIAAQHAAQFHTGPVLVTGCEFLPVSEMRDEWITEVGKVIEAMPKLPNFRFIWGPDEGDTTRVLSHYNGPKYDLIQQTFPRGPGQVGTPEGIENDCRIVWGFLNLAKAILKRRKGSRIVVVLMDANHYNEVIERVLSMTGMHPAEFLYNVQRLPRYEVPSSGTLAFTHLVTNASSTPEQANKSWDIVYTWTYQGVEERDICTEQALAFSSTPASPPPSAPGSSSAVPPQQDEAAGSNTK